MQLLKAGPIDGATGHQGPGDRAGGAYKKNEAGRCGTANGKTESSAESHESLLVGIPKKKLRTRNNEDGMRLILDME